jgi:hypothetical protein
MVVNKTLKGRKTHTPEQVVVVVVEPKVDQVELQAEKVVVEQ